jgi:hypothetical protein
MLGTPEGDVMRADEANFLDSSSIKVVFTDDQVVQIAGPVGEQSAGPEATHDRRWRCTLRRPPGASSPVEGRASAKPRAGCSLRRGRTVTVLDRDGPRPTGWPRPWVVGLLPATCVTPTPSTGPCTTRPTPWVGSPTW